MQSAPPNPTSTIGPSKHELEREGSRRKIRKKGGRRGKKREREREREKLRTPLHQRILPKRHHPHKPGHRSPRGHPQAPKGPPGDATGSPPGESPSSQSKMPHPLPPSSAHARACQHDAHPRPRPRDLFSPIGVPPAGGPTAHPSTRPRRWTVRNRWSTHYRKAYSCPSERVA